MNENVESLVLEQLRLIRADIRRLEERLSARIDGLDAKVDEVADKMPSVEGILFGLGGNVRGAGKRVEHIEAKLGID